MIIINVKTFVAPTGRAVGNVQLVRFSRRAIIRYNHARACPRRTHARTGKTVSRYASLTYGGHEPPSATIIVLHFTMGASTKHNNNNIHTYVRVRCTELERAHTLLVPYVHVLRTDAHATSYVVCVCTQH